MVIPVTSPKTAEPALPDLSAPAKEGLLHKGIPENLGLGLGSQKNSGRETPALSSKMRRMNLRPGRDTHFTKAENQSLISTVESFKARNPGLLRLRWDLIVAEYNKTVEAGREREPIYLAMRYRRLCRGKASKKDAANAKEAGRGSQDQD